MDEEARLVRERRRFARRQWARRWLAWRWLAVLVVVVLLVAGGLWVVRFSSLLAVSHVEVTGIDLLTPEEVQEAARVPMGEPLITVDTSAVRGRVQSLAPVAEVEVSRSWPDTVVIAVTERRAVAVVQLGSRFRGVDPAGVMFRDYRRRPDQLPLVLLRASSEQEALAEAAAVASALPAGVSRRVANLTVSTIDDIRLQLRDGRVVVWGSADQSDLKATVLEPLLARPGRLYDVSVPGQPTVSQQLDG